MTAPIACTSTLTKDPLRSSLAFEHRSNPCQLRGSSLEYSKYARLLAPCWQCASTLWGAQAILKRVLTHERLCPSRAGRRVPRGAVNLRHPSWRVSHRGAYHAHGVLPPRRTQTRKVIG